MITKYLLSLDCLKYYSECLMFIFALFIVFSHRRNVQCLRLFTFIIANVFLVTYSNHYLTFSKHKITDIQYQWCPIICALGVTTVNRVHTLILLVLTQQITVFSTRSKICYHWYTLISRTIFESIKQTSLIVLALLS